MNGYNCGPGSNPLAGPYASQFVELAPLAPSKSFADVDTTPPRMPDLLPNPVRSWHDDPPLGSIGCLADPFPPPRIMPEKPIPYPAISLGRMYVPEGRIERLAARGLLRFGDDY